jgi:hypothetical protein
MCKQDGRCRSGYCIWKEHLKYGTRINGVDEGSSVWNSVQIARKHLLMGVTVLLSLSRQIKKTRLISSLKRRPCCGIKDWDILEKRAFEHYTIKVWLKASLIALWIFISVNISYMVNIIK